MPRFEPSAVVGAPASPTATAESREEGEVVADSQAVSSNESGSAESRLPTQQRADANQGGATEPTAPAEQPTDTNEPTPPESANETDPVPPEPDAVSASCALDVIVTTQTPQGRYEPRNVGAIWITDGSDQLIQTLKAWGNRRLRHVEAWNGALNSVGLSSDQVDAVSSATLRNHETHAVSWDCSDFAGQGVPDGLYRVHFEVTESNGAGPNHFEEFEKSAGAFSLQANAASFVDIAMTFTP